MRHTCTLTGALNQEVSTRSSSHQNVQVALTHSQKKIPGVRRCISGVGSITKIAIICVFPCRRLHQEHQHGSFPISVCLLFGGYCCRGGFKGDCQGSGQPRRVFVFFWAGPSPKNRQLRQSPRGSTTFSGEGLGLSEVATI